MSFMASELMVITKTKKLCSYVMVATEKSPKMYRFTFVVCTTVQNILFSFNSMKTEEDYSISGKLEAIRNFIALCVLRLDSIVRIIKICVVKV